MICFIWNNLEKISALGLLIIAILAYRISKKTIDDNKKIKLYDKRIQFIQHIEESFSIAIAKNTNFLVGISDRMLYLKQYIEYIDTYEKWEKQHDAVNQNLQFTPITNNQGILYDLGVLFLNFETHLNILSFKDTSIKSKVEDFNHYYKKYTTFINIITTLEYPYRKPFTKAFLKIDIIFLRMQSRRYLFMKH